jgi:hypothetical protein
MPTTFERLFGTAGPLGSNWLGTANVPFSPTALHQLVVSIGLLEASQAWSENGHRRTKTLGKSDPTLKYWKSPRNLPTYLDERIKALNPTKLAPLESRLATLRAEPVGCILVVVQCLPATPTTHYPLPLLLLQSSCSLQLPR